VPDTAVVGRVGAGALKRRFRPSTHRPQDKAENERKPDAEHEGGEDAAELRTEERSKTETRSETGERREPAAHAGARCRHLGGLWCGRGGLCLAGRLDLIARRRLRLTLHHRVALRAKAPASAKAPRGLRILDCER
jgi:hypothetical protein